MTPPGLTSRDIEVLRALADGDTAENAARDLGIAHKTLKNHLTRVYRRLGVQSLVAAYRRLGWLVPQ